MKQFIQKGFTLIEMVIVIVILGVIGSMISIFMKVPIDAYISNGRRAALSDKVDTVTRTIERDLRRALPNSVNVSSSGQCLYLIPTKSGSRYRVNDRVDGDGTGLDFTAQDTSFNHFGTAYNTGYGLPYTLLSKTGATVYPQRIENWKMMIDAGDYISIYNMGIPGADAYAGDNVTSVIGISYDNNSPVGGEEYIVDISPFKFPFKSPSNRFQVISKDEIVLTYLCNGSKLYKITNSIDFSNSCSSVPTESNVISNNVDSCLFSYSTPDLQRNALVEIFLKIKDESLSEFASIKKFVHIDNTP